MQVTPVSTKKNQLIFDRSHLILYLFYDFLTRFQTVLLSGSPSLTSLRKAKLKALFFHFIKTRSKPAPGKNRFFAIFLKSGRTKNIIFFIEKKIKCLKCAKSSTKMIKKYFFFLVLYAGKCPGVPGRLAAKRLRGGYHEGLSINPLS